MTTQPLVAIVMGSDTDLPVMQEARAILTELGVASTVSIASAHRSPARVAEFATTARANGYRVIIAGAGCAAHLAGVIAAYTTLPVIGVPLDGSPLQGLDALLATVQMPAGVPVATVAIGTAGAKNAAYLAAQILALSDTALAARLADRKTTMAAAIEEKNRALS